MDEDISEMRVGLQYSPTVEIVDEALNAEGAP